MPIFQGYIAYAPFPEGFEGDMDETFQQSGQLATIFLNGNFLTGLYYPVGTIPPPVLPTSDQGPIALNGVWYFWDPASGQYLPQSTSIKTARNFAKNAIYQVRQTGNAFPTLPSGLNKTYDMALGRVTQSNIVSVSSVAGPPATGDNDNCQWAINYTVNNVLASLAATDLLAHEHLIEGADIAGIQGEVTSLSFSVMVNSPGRYSAYLTSANRDVSYVFSFQVATPNVWTRIKINNIPAFPTGIGTWNWSEGATGLYLGIVMAVGAQYQTTTPNQWVAGFFAGTAANQNMASVINNQIAITAIKFEASPTATFFTANSFDQDYSDCIRYYWTSFTYQSVSAGVSVIASAHITNGCFFAFTFPRRMCRVPTVVPYGNTTFTAGKLTNISTNTDYTVATLPATPKGVTGTPTGLTATKADVFGAYLTADARLS